MTGRVNQIFKWAGASACLVAIMAIPAQAMTMEKETLPVNGHAPEVTGVTFDTSTPVNGESVTATPIFSDADGDPVDIHYQWQLDGKPIANATNPDYTLKSGDGNGRKLDVIVTPFTDAALTEPFSGVSVTSSELITRNGPPDSGTSTLNLNARNGTIYAGAPFESFMAITLKDKVGDPAEYSGPVTLQVNNPKISTIAIQGCGGSGSGSVCQMGVKAAADATPGDFTTTALVNGLPVGSQGLSDKFTVATVGFHPANPTTHLVSSAQNVNLLVVDNLNAGVQGVRITLAAPSLPTQVLTTDSNGYIYYTPPPGGNGNVTLTATINDYSKGVHTVKLLYPLPYPVSHPVTVGINTPAGQTMASGSSSTGKMYFTMKEYAKGDVRTLLTGGNGGVWTFTDSTSISGAGVTNNGKYDCKQIDPAFGSVAYTFTGTQAQESNYAGSGKINFVIECML